MDELGGTQKAESERFCYVSVLCPSSGILNTRKHNVSETGSVSLLTPVIEVNSI
jgi:hypothetical protein